MSWPIKSALLASALAPGCIEFGLDPIDSQDPPVQRISVTERFVQEPLPAVDVLFVIDDTGSMEQEQAALSGSFAAFSAALDAADIAWQLGVTTTDMGGPEGAWLLGTPYVLTPETPNVHGQFAQLVRVGSEGPGPEAGLAAATTALALSTQGGPNAGFRRADATLHVVFVSDADDASDDHLPHPVSGFLAALQTESERTGLPALASALVGDAPSGCVSDMGAAQAGTRYLEVAAAAGGAAMSICDPDLSALVGGLGEASISYPQRFPLREPPEAGSVRVSIEGERVEAGWILELEPPAVQFDTAPAPAVVIEVTYTVANA